MRSRITFVTSIETTNGFKWPKKIYRLEVCANVKRYNNCAHILFKLSKVQSALLHYLCENMDKENNLVHNSKLTREEFRQHIKSVCNTLYSDSVVKHGFVRLKEVGMLLSFNRKGYFYVNPLYFYKGSEQDRKRLILKITLEYAQNPEPTSNIKKAFGL